HALCVGCNNYRKAKIEGLDDLRCSEADAMALLEVFRQHKHSALYRDANVHLLRGPQVTRSAILSALDRIAKESSSDDWVVLFLSGHGKAEETERAYKPGSFAYICSDSDESRKE